MKKSGTEYWKDTLRLIGRILVVWFAVSFGCGIIFAEQLNQFTLLNYPLGFWFAQQGSIYVFIFLTFYYARKMNKIDETHDVHEN